MSPASDKDLTPIQRKLKIEKYCAYEERSHQQVRDRLYDLGAHSQEVENVIVTLIQTGFLNEGRFVEAYVRGKFRMKGWGKMKIRAGLRPHRVDKKMMERELAKIDEAAYKARLQEIVRLKSNRLKEKNPFKRKAAILRHAAQKGYESHLIYQVLDEMAK